MQRDRFLVGQKDDDGFIVNVPAWLFAGTSASNSAASAFGSWVGMAVGVGVPNRAQALKTTASKRMKVVVFMFILHQTESARRNLL